MSKVNYSNPKTEYALNLTTSKNVLSSERSQNFYVSDDYVDNSSTVIASWDSVFSSDADNIKVSSSADGLIKSLTTKGVVDIEYIASLCNKEVKEVILDLKGAIYQNPQTWQGELTKGWETSDEYLSGNLIQKWRVAFSASEEYNGYFDENLAALEKLLPPKVNFEDIFISLGAPWLPVDTVKEFIYQLLLYKKRELVVNHDEYLGVWEIPSQNIADFSGDYTRNNIHYGTKRISALHIIEKTLNNQEVVIKDTEKDYYGKKKSVINKEETMLAVTKQNRIREEFVKWVNSSEERKEELVNVYTEKFGYIRTRTYDGSFLTFPNMDKSITLYSYQKNAIARILFSPNTLLAHDVGAGKTFIMVASGMELRRMGISKKNMYVVPNNIVGQWEIIFKRLYPKSNILIVSPKTFHTSKRQKVLKDIKENEYDAIIIASSCFALIPMSNLYKKNSLLEEINRLKEQQKQVNTARIKHKIKSLQEKYNDIVTNSKPQTEICFDELEINTLYVDEAHNYKNVPFTTQSNLILGINSNGSEKCQDMLEKVRCVQKQNAGRGVVFATGTPITNSISDVFIMQKYLQNGILEYMGINSFDSWVNNFAELDVAFEIDVDTNNYRLARRFTKFHNLPELTSMLALCADFYKTTLNSELPKFDGYFDCMVQKSTDLVNYLSLISDRADMIRNGLVKRTEDNMLKITTDGRKAALDVRLVNNKALFNSNCKIFTCADRVYDVYLTSYQDGGTQLVFCDTSTVHNNKFNAYDELKRVLQIFGIPSEEIAFVHEANSEAQREVLFEAVRKSKIRVLIGSTFKLGQGVNVQDHLIAIHHLDIPWRPADMVQREGRLIRQGNLNKQVYIYRYITEGSFDAYSWQLLETKQRFIEAILSGSIKNRSGNDVGDTVLGYAEVKALAIGNPLIKERVEVANELSKLIAMQRKVDEIRQEIMAEIDVLPNLIEKKSTELEKIALDVEFYGENREVYDFDTKRALRVKISADLEECEMLSEEKEIGEYQGFKIVVPTNMTKDKPCVYLVKNNRYKIFVGVSKVGTVIKIENFLENLPNYFEEQKNVIEALKNKLEGLKEELANKENYTDKIKEISEKLESLDKKLGVKKS